MTKLQLSNKTRSQIYTLVLFLFTLIASMLVIMAVHNQWREDRTNEQQFILTSQGTSLTADISHSLAGADIIASWVTANNGDVTHFDSFAQNMINALGGITNLQLAPDGIVSHISPLQGHESAIGHNILTDDKRRKEALLAIASSQMTLAGPFHLVQGGQAIVGRKPIFLDKLDPATGQIDPNERYFWGYASVLIYLKEIMANSKLNALFDQGYYYQLWRYHPDTGEKQIFARNTAKALAEQSSYTIKLPNTIWHLNIEPVVTISHSNGLITTMLLLLIIDLLLCGFVYLLLRNPSELKDNLLDLLQRQQEHRIIVASQKLQLRHYKEILDNSDNAILVCDINGSIKYVNQRLVEQSGYSATEMVGQTPSLFRSPRTSLDQHKLLWHEILCGNIWRGTICNSHKNGQLYWVDIKIMPLKNPAGEIVEFVASSTLSKTNPQKQPASPLSGSS